MTASEKVAYLKGLAEGLGIDKESNEGKLMLAMIEVMESFAADIEDLEANLASMADTLDGINDDIAYVEDLALGSDEDDDFADDGEEEDCSGNCSACGGCCDADYEVTCPSCGTVIPVYQEDIDFGSIICPCCSEELEFDNEDEE